MVNPLALFKSNRQVKKNQELKNRVLKNREGVLDAMAENIKGAKACPLLVGQKCLGGLCELFVSYYAFDTELNKKVTYHRCSFNQTPLMVIENSNLIKELITEQRATQKLLIAIYESKEVPV